MPDRQQWVFRNACGCPFGVMEFAGETRVEAWDEFYDGETKRGFAAMEAGATLVLVEHGRYVAEFYPQTLSEYRCPHGGGSNA